MIGLEILTAIAICGCSFLIYLLAAFWRELYRLRKRPKAEVVEVRPKLRLPGNSRLLVMDRRDLIHTQKKRLPDAPDRALGAGEEKACRTCYGSQ